MGRSTQILQVGLSRLLPTSPLPKHLILKEMVIMTQTTMPFNIGGKNWESVRSKFWNNKCHRMIPHCFYLYFLHNFVLLHINCTVAGNDYQSCTQQITARLVTIETFQIVRSVYPRSIILVVPVQRLNYWMRGISIQKGNVSSARDAVWNHNRCKGGAPSKG